MNPRHSQAKPYWRGPRLFALFSLFSLFSLLAIPTGNLAHLTSLGFLLLLFFLVPAPTERRTST